ncbi:GTPase activating protein (GAP) for Rho1p [Coemansia sp. Benny D115]|nr:GTPase activating protein (GAP) for Rho1p [Coemansia sp. Benny D115]
MTDRMAQGTDYDQDRHHQRQQAAFVAADGMMHHMFSSPVAAPGSIAHHHQQQQHHQHHSHHLNHNQYHHQQQQIQPTIASLALADSRGHLDSGLGYYQPHRLRADIRANHGFYSEPASGAGSPVSMAPEARSFGASHRPASSADNVTTMLAHGHQQQRQQQQRQAHSAAVSPEPSALGVVFSAPAGKTITMAASRYHNSSSAGDINAGGGGDALAGGSRGMGHSSAGPLPSDSPRQAPSSSSMYQHGGSASQLSMLPESSSARSFAGNSENNGPYHMAQNSTDFAPHTSSPSTPSISAASATAASSSFSFRNGQRALSHYQAYSYHSSQPLSQQSLNTAASNRHSTATTAATASNRDSMFLRLKEKIKHFKPRSRPQSDNLTDKRAASSSGKYGQSQPSGALGALTGSPSFNKGNRGNSSSSESLLFGMPLAAAVRLAGVQVGTVGATSEPCIVPVVVAVCGRHLCEQGQQTQGIFRVNGSMKRVQKLQEAFNEKPSYGRHTEWTGYTLHDAATILRRYLISLPESVISVEYYSAFLDKLAETLPDETKARDYGAMIQRLAPEAQHTLLYMLELLSIFAKPENCERTLMNASNLAAVLQPCLLVHPGHVANPHEYGKAKDVVEFLIVHASSMYPGQETPQQQQKPEQAQAHHGYESAPVSSQVADDAERSRASIVHSIARSSVEVDAMGGYVLVGEERRQNKPEKSHVQGAGLVLFGPAASHNASNNGANNDDKPAAADYSNNGYVANGDNTALAAPAQQQQRQPQIHQQPYESRADNMASSQQPNHHQWRSAGDSSEQQLPAEQHAAARDPAVQNGFAGGMATSPRGLLPPPPRGDSLVTMSMVMSTPVLSNSGSGRASNVRSLGSVTARLYDPSAPTPPPVPLGMDLSTSPLMDSYAAGWQSNRSSAALSSIQYQNLGQSLQAQAGDTVVPGGPVVSPGGVTRARRSLSFIMLPTSPRSAQGDLQHEEVLCPADRLSRDMMNLSSNAVHARRGVGERRVAGHVNINANANANANANSYTTNPHANGDYSSSVVKETLMPTQDQKPLPTIPAAVVKSRTDPLNTAVASASTGGSFHMYPMPGDIKNSPRTVAGRIQHGHATYLNGSSYSANSAAGYTKYDQESQSPPLSGRMPSAFQKHSSPQSQQQQQQQQQQNHPQQQIYSALTAGNGGQLGRASWLSEDAPSEDYEHSVPSLAGFTSDSGIKRMTMTQSLSFSESQQQKLHPIGQTGPVPMHQYGQMSVPPSSAGAAQQAVDSARPNRLQRQVTGGGLAESGKDKSSKTRLKNMFWKGTGGSTASSSKASSLATSFGPHQHPVASMPVQPLSAAAPAVPPPPAPVRFDANIQPPRRPRQPSGSAYGSRALSAVEHEANLAELDAARQIQVAVPAGHLSIVYPDSPMSKADTLRRNSVDSLTKRLSQAAFGGDHSGRAFLVDPDHLEGSNLHATPSNTTTLHSGSQLLQQQQHHQQSQHQNNCRAANVLYGSGGSSSIYATHRLADSDSRIALERRGTTDTFVLPDISNGSPLMSSFEFGGTRDSIHQQMQMQQHGIIRSRGNSRRSANETAAMTTAGGTAGAAAGGEDGAALGNSPRRSRSLRNTITSLKRKMSRSSRTGGAHSSSSPDMAPVTGGPTEVVVE